MGSLIKINAVSLCVVVLLATILFSCSKKEEAVEVVDLTCEYLTNPTGIDEVSPRLNWKILARKNNVKQQAYRIIVSSTPQKLEADEGDVWDSGKIISDKSSHIAYAGAGLKSRQKVFWKVGIWESETELPIWSDISTWEMAFLEDSDWTAKWIGHDENRQPVVGQKNPAPYFRKQFILDDDIQNARAYISGLGYYELFINGKKVGDRVLAPNQTNYDKRQQKSYYNGKITNMSTRVLYETHDITSYLRKGKNVVSVILGNGWYFQNERDEYVPLCYDTPRFIAQLEMNGSDNKTTTIISDESWKISYGPILDNNIYFGEIYDARKEIPGWDLADFDDNSCDNASIVRTPEGSLHAQMSPPDRIIRTIKPVTISISKDSVYRYDFGTMFSGWVKLKVKGKRGNRLTLHFLEDNDRAYGQSDTYILKGEEIEEWEPRFTWHAFRYVEVNSSEIELTLENLEGRVVHTDVSQAGTFESSNPLFNRIMTDFEKTQLDNMHGGVTTDCPHRERRGYTGDGQIAAQAAIFSLDMRSFYTKWLNDIADSQNSETGLIPNTAPFHNGGQGSVAWASAIIIIPYYMYLYYGDVRILKKHYPAMIKYLGYLNTLKDNDGLIVEEELGEWVPPDTRVIDPSFVSSAFYYYVLKQIAVIAGVLEKTDDSSSFIEEAENVKQAFNKRYLIPEKYSYSIGRQGANVFPLAFELVPENITEQVFGTLVRHIESGTKGHFDTGMMGTPYVLEVLTKYGRPDLAYTLMNQRDYPSFGYNIEKGATTLWETWTGKDSHSHPMFGSVCAWFFKGLAGINPDPDNPGFKHVIIKPNVVDELDFAKAKYESMYGEISSFWEYNDGRFNLEVKIPANTTATVYIPGNNENNVTLDKAGARFVGVEGDFLRYEIHSGQYRFIAKNMNAFVKTPMLSIPVITPADTILSYPGPVQVKMRQYSKNADIRYTLDGQQPDEHSELYTKPIVINDSRTIKARVFREGATSGFTKDARIVFVDSLKNGLHYNYYNYFGDYSTMKIPDFSKLTPQKTGKLYEISLEKHAYMREYFALLIWGKIEIATKDIYTFTLSSNDGSRLYIDDKLVIDADKSESKQGISGDIELNKGRHKISVEYYQAGGARWLELFFKSANIELQQIPGNILFSDEPKQ
jgi:alpha-L-rhamnosidase